MDPLEDRVRHLLSDDSWRVDVDTDSALTKVRAGAKRRRVRRNVGMAAAAVLVVAGGAGGVGYLMDVLPGQGRGEVTVASDNQKQDQAETLAGDRMENNSGPADTSGPQPEQYSDQRAAKFSAVSFTAAGPTEFWVLGAETKSTAQVLRTTDGGKSFELAGSIKAPVAAGTNQATAKTVSSLRFAVDGENGWAYGRALHATHDGGATWSEVGSMTGKVERLEIANGRAVALVKDGDAWSAWATPVASDSWERLEVSLSDPGDLALVGSRVLISDAVGDQTVVEASSNGGESFSTFDTECSADLSAGTFSVTADSAWLTCPTGTQASLFVSHDGGQKWNAVSSARLPNVALSAARTSSQTIVALPGEVRIVSDRGEPTSVPIKGLAEPAYAGFTTEKVGYVLDVDGKLFRTADGGQKWTEVTF